MSADNSTSDSEQQLSSRFVPCSSRKRRRIHSAEVNPPLPTTTIGKLADDVLVEILIRLPEPRSACRCKSVCKGWRSLLSDPIRFNRRFVSHHRGRNQQPPLLLPSDDPQSIITSFLPSMSPTDRDHFEVLDSDKDLLLCGFTDASQTSTGESYRSYFVCNPFTKQWVALPLAPELPTGSVGSVTRFVCRPRVTHNLDLGDAHQVFVYCPEYRFRVVRLYRHENCAKLDVFSSDSWKWTKDAVVRYDHYYIWTKNVVSCNGNVFWSYVGSNNEDIIPLLKPSIASFNPFRPDIRLSDINVPLVFRELGWDISVSQGVLHAIVLEDEDQPQPAGRRSSVWRLEECRKCWTKVCDGFMKKRSRLYELICSNARPCLHPEKPEVCFLRYRCCDTGDVAVMSCDLGTEAAGEPELFGEARPSLSYWKLFQAEFFGWPTSIPRYKGSRFTYNGSYSGWV